MFGRRRFLLPAAALMACVVAALGCSDGGGIDDATTSPLTLERYAEELSGLLGNAHETESGIYAGLIFAVGDDPSVGDQVDEAHDVAASYQDLLEELDAGLNELEPPAELVAAHRALVATIEPAVRSWEPFLRQLEAVETQNELYEAYDGVRVYLREFDDACDEIRDLVREAGVAFEESCSINIE